MTFILRPLPAVPGLGPEEGLLDTTLPGVRQVVHHPDGYYWLGGGGRIEVGPFASAAEALADLPVDADDDVSPDETLPEAEAALGLADWLDPDTGVLAEDTHLHLEDH